MVLVLCAVLVRFPQLPDWVSPMERDIAFWRSGAEGFSLLLKVVGSTSLLVVAVAARFLGVLLPTALKARTSRVARPA